MPYSITKPVTKKLFCYFNGFLPLPFALKAQVNAVEFVKPGAIQKI